MERTFRAEKMLRRIKEENREHLLDDEMVNLIKTLDGKVGNDFNWQSFVYDEALVWGC